MMRNQGLLSNLFGIYLFINLSYAELHALTEYVNLQIHFEKNVNTVYFTLNCSSMYPSFGSAAEILINNITTANMRSSNGVCYISRRICMEDECSCTSHNFVYSFLSTADTELLSFTCQLRFEQENQKSQLLVYETKIYNGSVIFEEKTNFQRIAISRSDLTQSNNNTIQTMGSGDFSIVYISILICIPVVMAIIALSILCLKCFNNRKMDSIHGGIQVSLEETFLLKHDKGHMQAGETELYTKLDETGTEEKTIMCHSISEERKMNGIDDGKPITPEERRMDEIDDGKPITPEERKIDEIGDGKTLLPEEKDILEGQTYDLYTTLNETGPEKKVMQCHRISEERKMHEIGDGKTFSPEESSGEHLQPKYPHPHTALNEPEIHTKSVIDQSITGKFGNSLNLKESSANEEYLQTRYKYSDPGLDNLRKQKNDIRIMPDESVDIDREKGINKRRKKPGYVEIHIEQNPEFRRATEPIGEKR